MTAGSTSKMAQQWEHRTLNIWPYLWYTWMGNPRPCPIRELSRSNNLHQSRTLAPDPGTFQKMMNLYLYLCLSSTHLPGVLKGLIFGLVCHFWLQNSEPQDYTKVIQDLYQHLCSRGHTPEKLGPHFQEAAAKVDSTQLNKTTMSPTFHCNTRAKRLLFHLQYHPLEMPNSIIHDTFNCCCSHLREELKVDGIIIAHTRQPNLRDLLCKTQLTKPEGNRASNILLKLDDS
jgi:hypothetical protein